MDKKSIRSKKEEEALRNLVFVKEQKPPPANKIQKELCKLMYCNKAFMILQNETDPENCPLDFTGLNMYGFEVPDPTEVPIRFGRRFSHRYQSRPKSPTSSLT